MNNNALSFLKYILEDDEGNSTFSDHTATDNATDNANDFDFDDGNLRKLRQKKKKNCIAYLCGKNMGYHDAVSLEEALSLIISALHAIDSHSSLIPNPGRNSPTADSSEPNTNGNTNHNSNSSDKFFWVHLIGPSFEEMAQLANVIPLHPSTAFEVSMEKGNGRDKSVKFDEYLHIVTHELLEKTNGALKAEPVHILKFKNFVVSVQSYPTVESSMSNRHHINNDSESPTAGGGYLFERDLSPSHSAGDNNNNNNKSSNNDSLFSVLRDERLENIGTVFKQLRTMEYTIPSPDWIIFAILASNLPYYQRNVDLVISEINTIQELVMIVSAKRGDAEDLLVRLRVASTKLSFLYWFMHSKQDIVSEEDIEDDENEDKNGLVDDKSKENNNNNNNNNNVAEGNNISGGHFSSHDLRCYIRHVSNIIASHLYRLEISKELLQDSQDTYLNMVASENEKSNAKADNSSWRLTVVATIFMPLSLIAGLWGMNIPVPGGGKVQNSKDYRIFIGLIVFMGIIIIASFLWMKYKRMI